MAVPNGLLENRPELPVVIPPAEFEADMRLVDGVVCGDGPDGFLIASLTTLGDIVATPQRVEVTSETATVLGDTAAIQVAVESTADELRIDPSADAISFIPLVRADSFGIDYDDEESVTLNAEQE